MEHAYPETDSGSNRRYVLTSVASSASFTQRRLSVNLSPIHIAPDPADGGEAYTTATSSSSLSSSVSTQPPSYSASLQQTPPYSHWHDSEERSMNQTREQRQRIAPPPILTKLNKDYRSDCPPLSFQTHSGQSLSSNSAGSKMSPSTPRSITLPGMVSRATLDGSHMAFDLSKATFPGHPIHPSQLTQLTHLAHPPRYLTPSPAEDCAMMEPEGDHDMEHCSEQDDVREREHEQDEDEDDEENDAELMGQRKVMKLQQDSSARGSLENAYSFQQRIVSPINRSNHRSRQFMYEDDDEEEEAPEEDVDGEEADTTIASSSSSRRMGLAKSPLRDEAKTSRKMARSKAVPRKRAPRQGSAQAVLEEALAEQEEDGQGQDGAGSQSLHGKGLGYYAPLVCDHVEAKGFTTYNDVVYELAAGASGDASVNPSGGQNGDGSAAQEPSGQGNIRRRVYDALNILEALGIISMDKKEIRWIGIQEAKAIRKVQEACDASQGLHQQERDVADESEEPEDDEMEIDQLQKEVEALRLRNALELAQLQDQVARHVQLNNLVTRNKQRESKEQDREERRRLKKLERKAEKRLQAETTGTQDTTDDAGQTNGESRRRTEKRHHHRRRSPRPDNDGDEDMGAEEEGGGLVKETDEEKARRRQEKKERRERKERRVQKRQEKEAKAEAERIQMPFVMVRMPGYAGQSSDSEASITVVRRRVREEQKPRKSGKSKRHNGEETSVVDITIPRQDEMSIISDTEILGDLGLSNVSMTDLRAMLPQEVVEKARYTSASADGNLDRVTLQGGFERAMPIPSRSSHPVHAHQRPPIRRSHSHTAASEATATTQGMDQNILGTNTHRFSLSHLLGNTQRNSLYALDIDDDLTLMNEDDEGRLDDDDDGDNDDDLSSSNDETVRHDSGHYTNMDVATGSRGIPIGKHSLHFNNNGSRMTHDHLYGTAGGGVDSRDRVNQDLHNRAPLQYGHSNSNSDGHSSINLMATNNMEKTHTIAAVTSAIASNSSLITNSFTKLNNNPADGTQRIDSVKQKNPLDLECSNSAHGSNNNNNTKSDSSSGSCPTRVAHSLITIDTSKTCLRKEQPKTHDHDAIPSTKDATVTKRTVSASSLTKALPESQLARGLKRGEKQAQPTSTFATPMPAPSSNSSTRPLMMASQSRLSSALPPTPVLHQHAVSTQDPQSSTLLPSLSPSSPRTNSALVNSLEQLSVSWKSPEHTPSFPINRLHRSRTISSGTRPVSHSSFSSGSSSSSTNPYQSSVMSPTTMVTSSSYSSLPYSPAVAFLSNFVEVTAPRMAPDEEGEQVGDFIMGKAIGHGGFSLVREAFAIHLDGLVAQVAVKIVKTQTGATDNDRVQRLLNKEIAIWSRLNHPNVLPFLAVEKLPTDTFVFCELCTGGNLLDYITRQEASSYMAPNAGGTVGLEEGQARKIFNQVAEAIRYLHEEKRIVHRDIKLENILQHEDGTWKICDFGLAEYQNDEAASYFGSPLSPKLYSRRAATSVNDRQQSPSSIQSSESLMDQGGCMDVAMEAEEEEDDEVGGSLAYCSPEQLRSQKPLRCPSSDVWSLGVVLYALLTGRLPFQDEYEPRLQYQILNGRYEEPTECSTEARDLLKNMFRSKPEERWRIGQVMDSPWCTGFSTSSTSANADSHAKMNNFFATFRM
ncbi:hypothetical protein BGZ51_005420 [Haplosporangium sp. Z 767]|nr:hypothetical protein BGZ51_005420 [Haplosporangium sp. Z 767]